MKPQYFLALSITAWLATFAATASEPRVRLETNFGAVVIELDPDSAPITVANFLGYVDSGFYSETIIHRIADLTRSGNRIIQGGGFTLSEQKPTGAPIQNEADNGLSNLRGTIAMARSSDPNSATAQFFFNVDDNAAILDYREPTVQGFGYAVFGRVADGLDVIDTIAAQPTSAVPGFPNLPTQPVVILRAERLPFFADGFDNAAGAEAADSPGASD